MNGILQEPGQFPLHGIGTSHMIGDENVANSAEDLSETCVVGSHLQVFLCRLVLPCEPWQFLTQQLLALTERIKQLLIRQNGVSRGLN